MPQSQNESANSKDLIEIFREHSYLEQLEAGVFEPIHFLVIK